MGALPVGFLSTGRLEFSDTSAFNGSAGCFHADKLPSARSDRHPKSEEGYGADHCITWTEHDP